MRKWGLILAVFLLIGSYWTYSVDLECHLQGFLECLTQHGDDATGCSAPTNTVDTPAAVLCPEGCAVTPAPLPPIQPQLPLCLCSSSQWWPPDPDGGRELGPPRAPPGC
ncbi:hypothetical protein IV102_03095 [bacterium]|nr:hypothetical protein [bacterium]